MLSTDQLRLQVDAYARYRIVDPLRMYDAPRGRKVSANGCGRSSARLCATRLGRRPFAACSARARGQMMDNIRNALNRVAIQYGARIVDVGSSAPTFPRGDAPRLGL